MGSASSHLLWMCFLVVIFATLLYLFFGGILAVPKLDSVKVADSIRPGQHFLSGMVLVPSPCDQISARAVPIASSTYALDFSIWEEPSAECKREETPRAFNLVLSAPAFGVQFVALVDGITHPIEYTWTFSGEQKDKQ